MRAEAPVPDADPELRAQPGRHQGVVHPVQSERRHGEPVAPGPGPWAEHAHAVDGPQALVQPGREHVLVRRDRPPADALKVVHGLPEGDRTDDIGRAGLLPLGRIRPDDLVEVDQVHRPAAGEKRIAVLEDLPRADERTGTEGRVELVAAEGDEIGPGGQGAMGGQLCRIEEDRDAACVRLGTDLLHRGQPARDVGGSRERQQGRAAPVVEDSHDVGGLEGAGRPALHPTSRRHTRPGEQVGVMLDHRRGDHVVGAQLQPVGQLVDGLRRVADQDHDVVPAGRPARESVHAVAGLLVGGGGAS